MVEKMIIRTIIRLVFFVLGLTFGLTHYWDSQAGYWNQQETIFTLELKNDLLDKQLNSMREDVQEIVADNEVLQMSHELMLAGADKERIRSIRFYKEYWRGLPMLRENP